MVKEIWLRCPLCEIMYSGEFSVDELPDDLRERESRVLDICPHCQQLGGKIYIREITDLDRGLYNG